MPRLSPEDERGHNPRNFLLSIGLSALHARETGASWARCAGCSVRSDRIKTPASIALRRGRRWRLGCDVRELSKVGGRIAIVGDAHSNVPALTVPHRS